MFRRRLIPNVVLAACSEWRWGGGNKLKYAVISNSIIHTRRIRRSTDTQTHTHAEKAAHTTHRHIGWACTSDVDSGRAQGSIWLACVRSMQIRQAPAVPPAVLCTICEINTFAHVSHVRKNTHYKSNMVPNLPNIPCTYPHLYSALCSLPGFVVYVCIQTHTLHIFYANALHYYPSFAMIESSHTLQIQYWRAVSTELQRHVKVDYVGICSIAFASRCTHFECSINNIVRIIWINLNMQELQSCFFNVLLYTI